MSRKAGFSLSKTLPFLTSQKLVRKRHPAFFRVTGRLLCAFRAIRSARDARHAAGLSLADMADRVAVTIDKQYSRTAIANMENPRARYYRKANGERRPKYRMPDRVRAVYVDALRDAIGKMSGGRADAKIRAGKTSWRAALLIRCRVCGDWFTPKRANAARCGWCIRHNQRREQAK